MWSRKFSCQRYTRELNTSTLHAQLVVPPFARDNGAICNLLITRTDPEADSFASLVFMPAFAFL